MNDPPSARLTIVGAGPAGMAVLVAACNSGQLHDLFAQGVTILERRDDVGAGDIGDYNINSDSHADSILRCLEMGLGERCPELLRHPATLALCDCRGRAAPLPIIAAFIKAIARSIQSIAASLGQPIATGMEALGAEHTADGRWITRVRRHADCEEIDVTSQYLVVATGAEQSLARLHDLSVAGQPLWPRYKNKLVLSREILTQEGLEATGQRLLASKRPGVAIIGGSHSAMSAAKALLDLSSCIDRQRGTIVIMHRQPLRPTYPTPELARAEGFDAFREDDICTKTGRVFPLSGFRSDSRELLLRILGLGRRPIEERIQLIDLNLYGVHGIAACLDNADIIVAATGYRPRALPLNDSLGRRIRLRSDGPRNLPMVGDRSHILDSSGRPIPGVFGIGLSAGFPLGRTHGEASFHGEANGSALWHSEIGEAIVRAVLGDAPHYSDLSWSQSSTSPLAPHAN